MAFTPTSASTSTGQASQQAAAASAASLTPEEVQTLKQLVAASQKAPISENDIKEAESGQTAGLFNGNTPNLGTVNALNPALTPVQVNGLQQLLSSNPSPTAADIQKAIGNQFEGTQGDTSGVGGKGLFPGGGGETVQPTDPTTSTTKPASTTASKGVNGINPGVNQFTTEGGYDPLAIQNLYPTVFKPWLDIVKGINGGSGSAYMDAMNQALSGDSASTQAALRPGYEAMAQMIDLNNKAQAGAAVAGPAYDNLIAQLQGASTAAGTSKNELEKYIATGETPILSNTGNLLPSQTLGIGSTGTTTSGSGSSLSAADINSEFNSIVNSTYAAS